MNIYIILLLLFSINAYNNSERIYSKYMNHILYLLFSFFYIFRWRIGSDWKIYEDAFVNIETIDQYKFELGYQWLIQLIRSFTSNYSFFIFIVSLFMVIILKKTFNREYKEEMGFGMLLSLFFIFYPSLESIRQWIALALYFYSLKYLIQNQHIKYIFINLIGMFFHRSTILTFLFLLVYIFANRKLILLGLTGIYLSYKSLILILPVISPIMNNKIMFYLDQSEIKLFSLKLLEYIIILAISLIISKKNNEKNKLVIYHQNLLVLGIYFQVMYFQFSGILYRLLFYLDFSLICIYIYIYRGIKNKNLKYIFISLSIIYVWLRFYRIFPYNNEDYIYKIMFFKVGEQ